MAQQDNILGSSAAITGTQSAMDILQARLDAANLDARVQSANSGYMGGTFGYQDAVHPASSSPLISFGAPASDPDWVSGREWLEQQQQARRQDYQARSAASSPEAADPWGDLGKQRGRADAQYGAWVEDTGRAGPRPGSVDVAQDVAERLRPSYDSYADAMQAKADILSDARNIYMARGDFGKIGGRGFNSEVEDAWASAGLHEKPGLGSRLMSGGGAFSIGYGAMQLGEAASRLYAADNSGQYVSPEQQAGNAAGLLPGALSILGAVGGAAIPGVGPIVGSMALGAVGSAAQGVIGASESREQATRETAERLSASLGSAAETVDRFKSIIESTGAPVAQLGQGVAALQNFGVGVGENAVRGAGRMALAEGVNYVADTQSVGRFLSSSPGNYQLTQQFAETGGELTPEQYRGIAHSALFEGDFGAYNAAQQGASAVRLRGDQTAQSAEKAISQESGGVFGWARDLEDRLGISNDRSRNRIILNNRQAMAATDDGSSGDRQYSLDVGAARLALTRSEADLGGQEASYGLAATGGASAADLARLLPGIGASVNTAVGADQSLIGLLNPNDPNDALKIARLQADQQQRRGGFAELGRQNFRQGLGEEQSGYDLTTLRARLEGRAPSEIAAEQRDQARFLEGVQGPLSPSERNTLRGQAAQLRYGAAQEEYGQEEGTVNLGVSRASADVQIAQSGGTPGQVYQAQIGYAKELTALQQQYNSEVERGNLTWEQANEKRREAVRLGGEINNAQDQARQSYFAGVSAIDDANTGSVRAGLARSVEIGGNSAYGALTAPNAVAVADARRAVDAAPPNTVEQRRAVERLSVLTAQGADNETDRQTYAPDIASDTRLIRDRSAFRVAMEAPYLDGPDSNPLTRGNALLGDLQHQRSAAEQDLKNSTDPLAIKRNTAIVGQFDEQIADLQHERMTGLFRALPEMVAGGTTDGYGIYAETPYALAAKLGGGNPMIGSIGRPNFGTPTPQQNVSVGGAFLDTAMNGGSGGDGVSLLREIAASLRLIAGSGGHLGVQAPPMGGNFGTLRNDLGRTFDTARPFDHLTH